MTGKLEKMPSREGLPSLCLTKKTKKNVDYVYLFLHSEKIRDLKGVFKLVEKFS